MSSAVIYRCKHCKAVRRVDYPHKEPRGQHLTPWRYRLDGNRRVYAGSDKGCSCGKSMTWNFVRGAHGAEKLLATENSATAWLPILRGLIRGAYQRGRAVELAKRTATQSE